MKLFLVAATLILAVGCSKHHLSYPKPPQPKIDANLPVIVHGRQEYLHEKESILYIPAGAALPVEVEVKGNAFVDPLHETLHVRLKEALYAYLDKRSDSISIWVSRDKRAWKPLQEHFTGEFSLTVAAKKQGATILFGLTADHK